MKVVALLPVVIFGVARVLAQAPPGPAAVQAEIAELLVAYPNAQYSWQQTDIARRLVAIGDPAVVDSIELTSTRLIAAVAATQLTCSRRSATSAARIS